MKSKSTPDRYLTPQEEAGLAAVEPVALPPWLIERTLAHLRHQLADLYNWEDHRNTIAKHLGCEPNFGVITKHVAELVADKAKGEDA